MEWASGAWGFAKRHKKKLLALGVLGTLGGGALYTYYSFNKRLRELKSLMPPPPDIDDDRVSVMRMQAHLQACLCDSERSVRSHLHQLGAVVDRLAPLAHITDRLKLKPKKKEKRELWAELKAASFTQLVLAMYGLCMLHLVVHLQLTLLARQAYRVADSALDDDAVVPVTALDEKGKMEVLMMLSHFNTHGMAHLATAVRKAVEACVSPSLTGQVTATDLEAQLRAVCDELGGGDEQPGLDLVECLVPKDVREAGVGGADSEQQQLAAQLKSEIAEIVGRPAFKKVLQSLVDTVVEFVVVNTFHPVHATPMDQVAQASAAAPPPHASSGNNACDGKPPTPVAGGDAAMGEAASLALPPGAAGAQEQDMQGSLGSVQSDTVPGVSSCLTPKMVMRLPVVVKMMTVREGELVWCLTSHPLVKELCSLVFTAGTDPELAANLDELE